MLLLSVLDFLGRGRSLLRPVKERGSNGALRSHLLAKGRTRRGGSRRSLSEGGTINYQLGFDFVFRFADTLGVASVSERPAVSKNPGRPEAEDAA